MKRQMIIVNERDHKNIYWASRYQNIHRLITHCSNRPKRFIANGILVVTLEELNYDNRQYRANKQTCRDYRYIDRHHRRRAKYDNRLCT